MWQQECLTFHGLLPLILPSYIAHIASFHCNAFAHIGLMVSMDSCVRPIRNFKEGVVSCVLASFTNLMSKSFTIRLCGLVLWLTLARGGRDR